MPELCYFYGIHIRINFNDHNPPHIHAFYAEHHALIQISDSQVLKGTMPKRAHRLIKSWLDLHRTEVATAWNDAQNKQTIGRIEPLE